MRRVTTLIALGLALVLMVLVCSLVTTYGIHDGARIGPGTWTSRVVDSDGNALANAEAHVVDRRGVQDFSDLGSARTDESGILTFRVAQNYPYGGWSVRVFWLWAVIRVPDPVLRVAAPGFESQDVALKRHVELPRAIRLDRARQKD